MAEIKGAIRINGRMYKAGDEDALQKVLTPELAKSLKERNLLTGDAKQQKQESPKDVDDSLPGGFPARMQLMKAGFKTKQEVRGASDEELTAIEGVGEATVKKIREAV
jgi:ERCC4-type nuclease